MTFSIPDPPSYQPEGMASRPQPENPRDDHLLGEIDQLVAGHHHDPHSILGARLDGAGRVIIRALRPLARSVTVVLPDGSDHPMQHRHQGVFEATLPVRITTERALAIRHRLRLCTMIHTATCRRSARLTCTSSARAGTRSSGEPLAP